MKLRAIFYPSSHYHFRKNFPAKSFGSRIIIVIVIALENLALPWQPANTRVAKWNQTQQTPALKGHSGLLKSRTIVGRGLDMLYWAAFSSFASEVIFTLRGVAAVGGWCTWVDGRPPSHRWGRQPTSVSSPNVKPCTHRCTPPGDLCTCLND